MGLSHPQASPESKKLKQKADLKKAYTSLIWVRPGVVGALGCSKRLGLYV